MRTGIVHVNDQSVDDEAQAPFGGVGDSGYGRFGGRAGMEAFSEVRWVTLQRGHRPPRSSYPGRGSHQDGQGAGPTGAAAGFGSDEMMTSAASRALRDGQVCFVGIGLPSTAANLARATHAP